MEAAQRRPHAREPVRLPGAVELLRVQHPLEWIPRARAAGWAVLVDCAAFVPTNRLDLSEWQPDFVPVSLYKLLGYPTGVGCLVARRRLWPGYAGPGSPAARSPRASRVTGTPWPTGGPVRGRNAELPGTPGGRAGARTRRRDRNRHHPHACPLPDGVVTGRVGRAAAREREGGGAALRARGRPIVAAARSRSTSCGRTDGSSTSGSSKGGRRSPDLAPDGVLLQPRARRSSPSGSLARTCAGRRAPKGSYEYLRALGFESGGAVRVSLGPVTTFADVYRFMRFVAGFAA